MKTVFAYIWEYLVKEEFLSDFKKNYAPDGKWVKLFKKAEGYLATDLHHDIENPNKFVTVDYWTTKSDRDNFRNKFSKEFEALDAHCEGFTIEENDLGDFETHSNRF